MAGPCILVHEHFSKKLQNHGTEIICLASLVIRIKRGRNISLPSCKVLFVDVISKVITNESSALLPVLIVSLKDFRCRTFQQIMSILSSGNRVTSEDRLAVSRTRDFLRAHGFYTVLYCSINYHKHNVETNIAIVLKKIFPSLSYAI